MPARLLISKVDRIYILAKAWGLIYNGFARTVSSRTDCICALLWPCEKPSGDVKKLVEKEDLLTCPTLFSHLPDAAAVADKDLVVVSARATQRLEAVRAAC